MTAPEIAGIPSQRQASNMEKFIAGRNIATRLMDLQMSYETGDDALIEQSIEIAEAGDLEDLAR